MPHQCLKCGKVFSEYQRIISGCDVCGNCKFIYTKKELNAETRKHLLDVAKYDMKILIKDVLSDYSTKQQGCIKVKKDEKKFAAIIKRIRIRKTKPQSKSKDEKKNAKKKEEVEKSDKINEIKLKASQTNAQNTAKSEDERTRTIEVINIKDSGIYDIDVEALLNKNPIIVHRNGVYLICLPSLFK